MAIGRICDTDAHRGLCVRAGHALALPLAFSGVTALPFHAGLDSEALHQLNAHLFGYNNL